jgi:Ca2+-binding RTX toxin-like protein
MAIITGATGDNPLLQGTTDADEIYGNKLGTVNFVAGNDRIFGLAERDLITGDGIDIAPNGTGGDDLIQGGDGDDLIFGDASGRLFGIAGDDTLYQNAGRNLMVGDADRLQTGATAGNDKLYGAGTLVGDSRFAVDGVILGDDFLSARSGAAFAAIFGDIDLGGVLGTGRGGNDILEGGNFGDSLYGDTGGGLQDQAVGGNDKPRARGGDDFLYGDTTGFSESAQGGNDVLRGGSGNDTLYGDGLTLSDFTQGGNDKIYGDAGNDELWGDGALIGEDSTVGKDRFFFSGNFGDDEIFDFRQEDGDRIVLQDLAQSEIQVSIVTVIDPDDSTLITTLGDDSILLLGFTGGLTVGTDIVFA